MTKNKGKFSDIINIKNKKAYYEYEILDKYVAGISLVGSEIKSIRLNKASLQEAYCVIHKGEMYVRSMFIAPYELGTHYNHEERRERKLLLKKSELDKLAGKVEEKGLSLIPLRLFINDRGLAKLEVALAKGKKIHDKRDSIKEKDMKRELEKIKF
jgi:SsrA-binding protein